MMPCPRCQHDNPAGHVESKSLDAHLFRVDMETGANPFDVLVMNEVMRVLTETFRTIQRMERELSDARGGRDG